MERKGSGFGKIIGGYEFQINYDESKKPTFRSDRYQFTVVMPNLNYHVSRSGIQDVPRNGTQDGTQDGTRNGTQDGTQDGTRNVPQDGTWDDTRNVPQSVPQSGIYESEKNYIVKQIKKLIKKNNKISTEKMSIALGVSVRTIKRRIRETDEIQFVGRGCNGHWEIIKKEKVISQQNSDTPQA